MLGLGGGDRLGAAEGRGGSTGGREGGWLGGPCPRTPRPPAPPSRRWPQCPHPSNGTGTGMASPRRGGCGHPVAPGARPRGGRTVGASEGPQAHRGERRAGGGAARERRWGPRAAGARRALTAGRSARLAARPSVRPAVGASRAASPGCARRGAGRRRGGAAPVGPGPPPLPPPPGRGLAAGRGGGRARASGGERSHANRRPETAPPSAPGASATEP